MHTPTSIDAARAPIRFSGEGTASARLERLRAEFVPLFGGGAGPLFVRNQGGEHYVTARPDDTLEFPRSGPRSGESRYVWEDRGDGVLYGRLRPEA